MTELVSTFQNFDEICFVIQCGTIVSMAVSQQRELQVLLFPSLYGINKEF